MRDLARTHNGLAIVKLLENKDFIWLLSVFIIPTMIGIRPHSKIRRLSAIGQGDVDGHEVIRRDGVDVCDGKGVFVNCFDRAPDLKQDISPMIRKARLLEYGKDKSHPH